MLCSLLGEGRSALRNQSEDKGKEEEVLGAGSCLQRPNLLCLLGILLLQIGDFLFL